MTCLTPALTIPSPGPLAGIEDRRLAAAELAREHGERPGAWMLWAGWTAWIGCAECAELGADAECWGEARCHGFWNGCGCADCVAHDLLAAAPDRAARGQILLAALEEA